MKDKIGYAFVYPLSRQRVEELQQQKEQMFKAQAER